jgi:hypothetical protein
VVCTAFPNGFLEKDTLGAHIHEEEIKKVTKIGFLEKEERDICMGYDFFGE